MSVRLADPDDDVRAVAADTLTPIVGELLTLCPAQVQPLMAALTASLGLLDDLTASTAVVLGLLGPSARAPRRRGAQLVTLTADAVAHREGATRPPF